MKVFEKKYFVHAFRLGHCWQEVCLEQKFDDVNDLFDYLKENVVSVEDGYDENGIEVLRFSLDKNVIACKSCKRLIEVFKMEGLPNVAPQFVFEEYRKTLDKE